MFITENKNAEMWTNMLKESFGVQDPYTLNWVSEYANVHAIKEAATLGAAAVAGAPLGAAPMGGLAANAGYAAAGSAVAGLPGANGVSPLYATPLNTLGMGNVAAPGPLPTTTANPGTFFAQTPGSGDIPVSTLPMALNIALLTIGLELVPVIPAKGPWQLLTYMDFPYAGGKLGKRNEIVGLDGRGEGRENKPLYVKVLFPGDVIAELRASKKFVDGAKITFTSGEYVVTGSFKSFGRMDGGVIIEVISCVKGAENVSLAEAFAGAYTNDVKVNVAGEDITVKSVVEVAGEEVAATKFAKVDFAQTMVDFIDGFANFATGKKEPMTRAQNETGTGNVIGLRLFSKWIPMNSYEVTATVTRQQLQDLPLYGVDAVSKVMEACQNEITQSINARILEHVFALGVTNAINQRNFQNVDLNLHMGTAPIDMADTAINNYKDIFGVEHKTTWGEIKNSEVLTSAENLHTRQRRIASRILAAANLIQVTGRRGRATWAVTNAQIATALQDCSQYVVAPIVNNMAQDGSQNLYLGGRLAGLSIYVDPYMTWDDCRVCVGRKGNGNEPGVIFMPYILADTVSITAEGTMAPKMLVNSRYAIADAGFFPEAQYYTFCVSSDFGLI